MTQEIKDAIQESIKTGSPTIIEADLFDIIKVGEEMGYGVDYDQTFEETYIWGWTSQTKQNDLEWNLLIINNQEHCSFE